MALIEAQINNQWINLPTPKPENYQFQNTHIEQSSMTANGYLHREIIRRNRSKIFCGWNYLDAAETSLLESLYNMDFFYLKCTDNHNNRVIKKVYAGPLDSKAISMNNETFEIIGRTQVQMNFIEY